MDYQNHYFSVNPLKIRILYFQQSLKKHQKYILRLSQKKGNHFASKNTVLFSEVKLVTSTFWYIIIPPTVNFL